MNEALIRALGEAAKHVERVTKVLAHETAKLKRMLGFSVGSTLARVAQLKSLLTDVLVAWRVGLSPASLPHLIGLCREQLATPLGGTT